MKKLVLVLLALVVLVGMALVITVLKTTKDEFSSAEIVVVSDSMLAPLPGDQTAAQKELKRVRAALAKLAPKGPYIVIDTHANKLSFRTEDSVLLYADCSTGSGGELVDSATGRHWIFDTPRGVFKVDSKLAEPWWRKPDWAYLEEGEKPPKKESERYDPEMMGAYAIGFGNGYFIHGTIYERLLGVSVTHGCVRLGSDDLEKLNKQVKLGTPVYIF